MSDSNEARLAETKPQVVALGPWFLNVSACGSVTTLATGNQLLPAGGVTVQLPFAAESFYRHGWNSWSPTGWVSVQGPTLGVRNDPLRLLTADDAVNETITTHSGSAVGAVTAPDGSVLLLGYLGLGSARVGATEQELWGTTEVQAGEWFLGFGDEAQVFGEYATLLSERLGKRNTAAGRVWSSWYSFYEDIDETLIAKTVADLAGEPIDVFQIDDGWERAVGDWEAGEGFASGMAVTAARIRANGFRPGLWLAPLIAMPNSDFARNHQDLLVQTDDAKPLIAGYNWDSPYYALDITNPQTQEHLRDVLTKVTDWGYTYLKLDFMYAGAVAGRRSVQMHREDAYRFAIEFIREVVGDCTYLLGCGVPLMASAGVFDGVRVGPDVAGFWDDEVSIVDPSGSGARNSLATSISRAWLRPLYELDPDAVYFRSVRSTLDAAQRLALRDAAHVLQFRSTSDPLSWLEEAEREEFRAFMRDSPRVEPAGRLRFLIDSRLVDFGALIAKATPTVSNT